MENAIDHEPAGNGSTSPLARQDPDQNTDILKISRHTLHGDVVERLRDMIIEGQLAPGTRINEGQLGASLGVSRTPLREAIKSIAGEGLIELAPGRGAIIRTLTPRDVQEMLEVLTALETTGARLACRVASAAEIDALRAGHSAMMRCYEARDRLGYYKHNQAFHIGLGRLSGNRFLAAQHEAISLRLKRIRYLGNSTPARWAGAVAEHEAMIAALVARDEEALCRAVTQHLDRCWDKIKDSL